MLESYFFIPGTHPKIREKIVDIKADNIIIDLEDSILGSKIKSVLEVINEINNKDKIWVRPALFDSGKEQFGLIKKLVKQGFRNFILPKIRNFNHIKNLEAYLGNSILNELSVIILVENPECLLNLTEILTNSSFLIEGIGFGSHDYCIETRMKHTNDFLKIPRFQIMNTAKANGVKAIDIACMDFKAGEIFTSELKEAFEMGFDGKFLIHPSQLEMLKKFAFYSQAEVIEAESILYEHNILNKPAVFSYNNRVIEPPHINYYNSITEWRRKYEIK
jgi:citrate lyase beta subunit